MRLLGVQASHRPYYKWSLGRIFILAVGAILDAKLYINQHQRCPKMTILTSHRPRETNINASDVFDLFIGDVEVLIWHACFSCASVALAPIAKKRQNTLKLMEFVQLQGTESPTAAATLYERVAAQSREMAETNILPCIPRPSWPCSSALQHHKWRHRVSWREGRKREYYNRKK